MYFSVLLFALVGMMYVETLSIPEIDLGSKQDMEDERKSEDKILEKRKLREGQNEQNSGQKERAVGLEKRYGFQTLEEFVNIFTDPTFDALTSLNYHVRSVEALAKKTEDMFRLEKDYYLTLMANYTARTCTINLNSFVHRLDVFGYDYVGETLFLTDDGNSTFEDVAQCWYAQGEYYDHENMTCEEGKPCNDFLQVVWAKTTNLGCAVEYCPTVSLQIAKDEILLGTNQFFVVCNYGEGGPFRTKIPYTKRDCPCPVCTNQESEYCSPIDGLCNYFYVD